MAYCKNCHKYIDDGLKYCEECADKINGGDFSEDYLDNLLKSVVEDDEKPEDNDESADVNDIEVLDKIFGNFSEESKEDEEDSQNYDGSNMDIESLIEEGNQYSKEIINNRDNSEGNNDSELYDENGMYIAKDDSVIEDNSLEEEAYSDELQNVLTLDNIAPDEEAMKDVNDYIDNATEDELLELLDNMANDDSVEEETTKEEIEVPTNDDEASKDDVKADFEDNANDNSEEQSSEYVLNQDDEEVQFDEANDETDDASNDENNDTSNDETNDVSEKEESKADDEFSTEDGTVFMAKKKESIFKKLFGNVINEDEESNDSDSAQEDEDEDEEAAKLEKKKQKEEAKQAKLAAKQALKEKKADEKRRKAAQKELENKDQKDDSEKGHINKIGASIVFVLAAGICVAIIITQTRFSYSNKIKTCEKYYDQGQYKYAYLEINGMKLKGDDVELYDKLRTIMYVQQYIDDGDNFYEIKLYDKSVHAFLTALEKYKVNYETAQDNEVADVYDTMYQLTLEKLNEMYGIDENKANEIISKEDGEDYSLAVREYTKDLYLEEQ